VTGRELQFPPYRNAGLEGRRNRFGVFRNTGTRYNYVNALQPSSLPVPGMSRHIDEIGKSRRIPVVNRDFVAEPARQRYSTASGDAGTENEHPHQSTPRPRPTPPLVMKSP
jgi:hypothetical protein